MFRNLSTRTRRIYLAVGAGVTYLAATACTVPMCGYGPAKCF